MPKTTPSPYVLVVDSREQNPYTFARPLGQGRGHSFQLQTQVKGLPSGDYSILGYEHRIAVERKSKSDLFGTLGGGRERFIRELTRLDKLEFAAIIVESEWGEILSNPPPRSKLSPRSVFGSILAWQQRYRVHWWLVPGRAIAEATTARILDRFWRDHPPAPATAPVDGILPPSDGG